MATSGSGEHDRCGRAPGRDVHVGRSRHLVRRGPEDGVDFARDGFVRLTAAGAEQAGTNAVGLDFFATTSASRVGSTATRAAQERREPAA